MNTTMTLSKRGGWRVSLGRASRVQPCRTPSDSRLQRPESAESGSLCDRSDSSSAFGCSTAARRLPNVVLACNRQEPEGADVAQRVCQPVSGRHLSLGKGGPERGGMSFNDMPVSAHFGQDQDHANRARSPSPVSPRQPGQQPTLAVEGDQHALQIPQPSLGLYDEQCLAGGAPCKQIGRTALAEM